jgi:hypothetical protein
MTARVPVKTVKSAVDTVLLAYISAVDRAVNYCGGESPYVWPSRLVKVFQDLWPDLASG